MPSTTLVGKADHLGIGIRDVCAFYETHWPRQIALSRSDFSSWQFRSHPELTEENACCVAVNDGELVGVMGVTPRAFKLSGAELRGAELTTWITSRRGIGIGARMLDYLKEAYQVLLGTGITQEALPLYMAAGFRYRASIPRYAYVYDWAKIAPYGQYDRLSSKLQRYWPRPNKFHGTATKVDNWIDASSIADTFLKKRNYFSRSATYLRWRYELHPVFRYSSYIIEAGGVRGVLSIRVDRLPEFSIAHIVDIYGDENFYTHALDFFHSYCQDNDVSVADFMSTDSHASSFLMANGWYSVLDDKGFKFPHLFYPVELRDPPTTSLIYWSNIDFRALNDTARLHLTKSDLDLDRPTIEYYVRHGLT